MRKTRGKRKYEFIETSKNELTTNPEYKKMDTQDLFNSIAASRTKVGLRVSMNKHVINCNSCKCGQCEDNINCGNCFHHTKKEQDSCACFVESCESFNKIKE